MGHRLGQILAVLALLATSPVVMATSAVDAHAAVVNSISVRGNQRVDAETIRSYITIVPGRSYSSFDTDESLQRLYSTGLFADVRITRSGSTLLVQVQENPTINLVLFEGNDNVKDDQLKGIVQSQSLGIFSQDKVDSDIERIREAVRRSGRASSSVTARIDQLDNNRVNVVYQINEGGRTKIRAINFVGNNAFGDNRLLEVISHNRSNILSWLKRDDIYDADKLRADEGRLRTFYFNRGYADFNVISAVADFDQGTNSYTITITVDEGDLYRFGSIQIDNALAAVNEEQLRRVLEIAPGQVYSARDVEGSLVAMTEEIARSGYAFAEVTPRGDRNFDSSTIDIVFFVDEGPRVYIERIDVVGNDRTRDYVIRREFDVSEGDAYNKVLVNLGKTRLEDLGFFDGVRITTRPGSAPDRVVLIVEVKDTATGEFSIGGGYSTTGGLIAEISLAEKNFLGRGQFVKVSAGFGDNTSKYELSFTEPYFLGHRIAAGFDLLYQNAESNSQSTQYYDTETLLGRIRASAPITENFRFGVNYTLQSEEVTADPLTFALLSPAVQDTIVRSPYTTSSLGYNFLYSTLDNTNMPREGIFARFTQNVAGVGGDGNYIRTEAKLIGYYLLSEDADIVFRGSAGAGNMHGFGSGTIRITDHFYQGGETIKGFKSRGLGPRDAITGEALGGLIYYNAQAEIKFPFFFLPRSYGIYGAIFAEAGTLYDNDFVQPAGGLTNDSNGLRASVGASVIWDSPFGPLRADFSHICKKNFLIRPRTSGLG